MGIGFTQKKVLNWMQEHPLECKKTGAYKLANKMADDLESVGSAVYQSINKLMNSGVVLKLDNYKQKTLFDFVINYSYVGLPASIVANAPKHEQEVREATAEKLKSGEYLDVDEYGAGITKRAEELEPLPEPMELELPEPPVEPQPVDVQIDKDGKTISISLTINLNL